MRMRHDNPLSAAETALSGVRVANRKKVCSQGVSLNAAANDEEVVVVLDRKAFEALVSLLINIPQSACFVRSGRSRHVMLLLEMR